MNKASHFAVSVGSTLLLGALSLAPFASVAQAQTYYGTYGTPTYAPAYATNYASADIACVSLTAPMTIGSTDGLTGGQVSALQTFLVRDGLVSSQYVTGYFGRITASAVAQFQSTHGIQPSGVVGPLTRAAIQQTSCGNTSIISPAQPINPYSGNNGYGYNNGNGYQYGYNATPELSQLSASYQSSNTVITLTGYGFDSVDNTVFFGGTQVGNIASPNGTSLYFTVPNMAPGTYSIYVTTSRGTSNSLTYTISNSNNNTCQYINGYQQCGNNCVYNTNNVYNSTSYYNNPCSTNSNGVSLSSLSATSGNVGTSVTVYGNGFTSSNNTVNFGGTIISNLYSNNGTSLVFTVPNVNSNYNSGTYSVYVTNGNGQSSNSITFNINGYTGGNGGNGLIDISYISPTAGNTGTQVQIQGSGFSTYGNIVHFGNGGSQNVQSFSNGTLIDYTIPYSISGCDLTTSGQACAQYVQQVTQGTYPIYVTNQNGQSTNSVSFQVY